MTSSQSLIHNHTIGDVSSCGSNHSAVNFHVFKTDEIIFDKEKHLHPVRSNHFKVGLALGGSAYIKINLTDYELTKNSLFIIPDKTVHKFLGKQDGHSAIVISFSNKFLTDTGMHLKFIEFFNFLSFQQNYHFSLPDSEAEILYKVLTMLHDRERFEEDHFYKTETIHHIFNLLMLELLSILKKYSKENSFKTTRKEDILMIFFKLLKHSFREERSVRYYADQMFVTSKHLTKTVKELTSKTCIQLIDEMVITEAKIMLHDLSMSVGNVADALHFSDQFFFSKFFKNHTGLTPSEYKIN